MDLVTTIGSITAIVLVLCQVVRLGLGHSSKKKWIPLFGVLVGAILGITFGGTSDVLAMIAGIMGGLVSGGVYEFAKRTFS